MRRGAGIGAIKKQSLAQAKFQEKGGEMAAESLDKLAKQMDTFKEHLATFAAQHAERIRANPAFRANFQQMCATAGVDPLASSKGFWSQVLGLGDFYYTLAVKITELAMALAPRTGGLLDLQELCDRLNKARSPHESEVRQARNMIPIILFSRSHLTSM